MLNSFDSSHIYVGVYDETGVECGGKYQEFFVQTSPPGGINFGKSRCFGDLESCLKALTDSKVAACLHVLESDSSYKVDIYLDQSRKIVQYYAKQLILENVLGGQTSFIEQTSEELVQKLWVYSSALSDAKFDLISTQGDLQEQELILVQRQSQLREVQRDFDYVYLPLKQKEPQINSLREEILENQENLERNISYFREKKQQIEIQINSLKTFLSGKLISGDYIYVSSIFDSLLADLNEMNSALSNMESLSNQQDILLVLDLLGSVIPKLDSINQALYDTDADLTVAIEKTREGQIKITEYISRLAEAVSDLEGFKSIADQKGVVLNFKEDTPVSGDPILIAFPLLVTIIITFSSLVLSNLFIVRGVNRESHFRELISPTRDVSFLSADYLINLFFVLIQAAVLFLVGFYWVGISINTLLPFAFTIFLVGSFFIFIGMSLGFLIKSPSLSMLLTIFLVMLFIILSDLLVPTLLLSQLMKLFIDLSPFVMLSEMLKSVLVLEKPVSSILWRVIFMGVFLFLAGILVYISKKINKRRIRD